MKFDSYHPTINLIYFTSVIAATICFKHPAFLTVSYFCAFVYSVKLNGVRTLVFDLCLIPLIAAWTWWYSYYNHFGITVLSQNFIDNSITLEAVVYGAVTGVIVAAVLMWFSCIHAVVSSDKIIYLFGRVSPKLSLFLSIILRTVPRIKERAKKINTAQRCIGRGLGQGNIFRRFVNFWRIVSIVITWILEYFVEVSDSMRCRGYGLKGRTAFSIYRFDNRDRSFVIVVFWCLTVILMAVLLDQVNIQYNPEIIFNRITPLSYVFYAAYAFLCLLPMGLQVIGETRFGRMRNQAKGEWKIL